MHFHVIYLTDNHYDDCLCGTLHKYSGQLTRAFMRQNNPTDKAFNSSLDKTQAVPALRRIAGLHQARAAHHRVHGPDTRSNSGGRQITKTRSIYCFENYFSTKYEK